MASGVARKAADKCLYVVEGSVILHEHTRQVLGRVQVEVLRARVDLHSRTLIEDPGEGLGHLAPLARRHALLTQQAPELRQRLPEPVRVPELRHQHTAT